MERHRPYFVRERIIGCRAIFESDTSMAWGMPVGTPTYIEGVVFADLEAAKRFDLRRLAPGIESDCWLHFDTWADAVGWLEAG